jgi:hypothetical protein
LIASAEVRSPIVEVSAELAARLDREIANRARTPEKIRLVNAG